MIREIELDEAEAGMLLEAAAGHYGRSADPAVVLSTFQFAQRLEGFDIDGRTGSVRHADGSRLFAFDGEDQTLMLTAIAGLIKRHKGPDEVTAAVRLAQRIEGFEIGGRPGSRLMQNAGSEEDR